MYVFAKDASAIDALVTRTYVDVEPYAPGLMEFVAKYRFDGVDGLFRLADYLNGTLASPSILTASELSYPSENYLMAFVLGLAQYFRAGREVTDGNYYNRFLRVAAMQGHVDDEQRPNLDDDGRRTRKLANRFDDAMHCVQGRPDLIAPIYVGGEGNFVFKVAGGSRTVVGEVDGHHRLFAALMTGTSQLQIES